MNAGVDTERSGPRDRLQRGLFALGVALLAASMIAGFFGSFETTGRVPFGALTYQRITRQYLEAGDYESAVFELRGEQRINEAQSMPTLNLAAALRALGDQDGVLEALRVGAHQSLDPLVHVRYAQALAAAGRLDDAERSLHRATALEPTDANAYVELAQFLTGRGRYEEAVRTYERALELDASLGEARYLLNGLRDHLEARDGAGAPAAQEAER